MKMAFHFISQGIPYWRCGGMAGLISTTPPSRAGESRNCANFVVDNLHISHYCFYVLLR